MDWEKLGYMVGNTLALNHAQNYYDRGVDKARKQIDGAGGVTDGDREQAAKMLNAGLGGGGLIGQSPQLSLLKAKRDWMQADNDAQYLLNNGYAENSKEVQGFRKIQADAHTAADGIRALGKNMGYNLDDYGTGLSLQELNGAVNRGIAPGLYQEFPNLGKQIGDRNAWAGKTAKEIMQGVAQNPQAAQGVPVAQGLPTQGFGTMQPQMVGGVSQMIPPAARLDAGGYSQADVAQAIAQNAGVIPQGAPVPQQTAAGFPTGVQMNGYAPQQGANLIGFDPNGGFGMTGTANPTTPGGTSKERTVTSGDIYKFLQAQGMIPKDLTYEQKVEEIAQMVAKKRASAMSAREVEDYLKERGVPRKIAQQVAAERTQEMQQMMKQEALARAAAASPNSQMAQLIAVAAADPKMKLSDLTGIINATNPNMGFETIDQGAGVSVIGYDKNGRVRSTAEFLPKSLSPKDVAEKKFQYDKLKTDVDIANQNAKLRKYGIDVNAETSRGNSMRSAQATLGAADIRGRYGLASAEIRAQGRDGTKKRSAAEEQLDAKYGNQASDVIEYYNTDGDTSREAMGDAVERYRQSVEDGIERGEITGEDRNKFRNEAVLMQLLYAAKFGEKEEARKLWGNFDEEWLQDPEQNPHYDLCTNIYQWMTGEASSPFDKARAANTLPDEPQKEYVPTSYEDSGSWMYR
nr:MAG TPA: hypothetical protein [Caudoviricetes sp.]